mmetsp:Transcript_17915/g.29962  ORF Transcript_17915/g.29962 Transcript_17915/m.29962 type:complete len:704 (+) Transcript_17915:95-2206(+)
MEEGSPIFSHLFSSPLTHEVTGAAGVTMTAVDELDYQAERRSLKQLLEKSSWVDIRWRSSHCSITNFLDSFTNCKILHFTGHGEQGVLAFENNFGVLQWVSHQEVSEMCRSLTDKPEVVFLSACFGLTSAQAFVDLGIPHVVSVTADRVLDGASLEFTDAFYSGLFSGKSVAAAFQLGMARLVAQFPSEKDKFRLLGGHGDEQVHEVCLFGSRSAPVSRPHFDASVRSTPPSQCDASAVFSLGRLVPVQEVYGLLQHGLKLVNIVGPRGVGKTEVALKVAEYARERHSFSQIMFVDFTRMGDCSEGTCLEKVAAAFMSSALPAASSASVFSFAQAGDIDGTVDTIRQHFVNFSQEDSLLVLDGLDSWLSATGGRKDFLRRLVTQLRQRLGQSVAMLLTSSTPVEVDNCRTVMLEGLSDAAAAKLLALRAPRPLDSDELYLDANQNQEPIKAFSKTKLLQSMKGNCKVIELVAKELLCDGQPQNLLRYETYFREEIIPNISQLVQLGNQAPSSWTGVQYHLNALYRQVMGIELCRARPFTNETFEFFASCPAWGPNDQVPALNGFQVLPGAFASFLEWFVPLIRALKRSGLWGRPHCIHGFTSRHAAAALLANSEVGTFLIGVSQTEGCLVINVVTAPGKVLPVKAKFNADSLNPFTLHMKHGMTTSFVSLEELIRSTAPLLNFFPAHVLDNGHACISKESLLP